MFNNTKLKKFTSMLCASLMIGTSSCFYKDRAGAQVIYYDENGQEITNPEDHWKAKEIGFGSKTCILLVYDGKNTKKDTLRPITDKTYWQKHARIKSDSLDKLDVVSMTCEELTKEITVSTKRISDELIDEEYEYPNQKQLYNAYGTEIYHFAVVTDKESYAAVGNALYRSYVGTNTAPSPYAGILLLNPDYSLGSPYERLWSKYTVRWPDKREINNESTSLANQTYPIRLVGNPDQLKLTDGSPARPYMLFLSPLQMGKIKQTRLAGVDLTEGINRNYAETEKKKLYLTKHTRKLGTRNKR